MRVSKIYKVCAFRFDELARLAQSGPLLNLGMLRYGMIGGDRKRFQHGCKTHLHLIKRRKSIV